MKHEPFKTKLRIKIETFISLTNNIYQKRIIQAYQLQQLQWQSLNCLFLSSCSLGISTGKIGNSLELSESLS